MIAPTLLYTLLPATGATSAPPENHEIPKNSLRSVINNNWSFNTKEALISKYP